MSCIGTAGHVDHGKSTLVKVLTGIDPDRLAEEKERGMTIDLGFAWLKLPGGREVSIVDVPGHESFIKNMLAGVGGIDAALLVVAADEGVMPQTREHLAILDLLGVKRGVVALTKCELVDDEWLGLVREEVAEQLQATTLAGAPIIPVSAYTGQGIPELLTQLDLILDQSLERQDIARPRLPIDRVFTLTGFGTIVTGTLLDGKFFAGQEVQVLPGDIRVRIRTIQSHQQQVEQSYPGSRVALNLANIAKSDLKRGDVIALPGQLRSTMLIDVRLRLLEEAPRPLAHATFVDFFSGSQEVQARVALLDTDELKPGQEAWAQLRLARPSVVARRDRFIIRFPSPSMTIGGGEIIDPHPRYHRRFQTAVLEGLRVLEQGSPEELVLAALDRRRAVRKTGENQSAKLQKVQSGLNGFTLEEVSRQSNLALNVTQQTLETLLREERVKRLGALWFAGAVWEALTVEAVRLVREQHQHYPLRNGLSREEWRTRLNLPARVAVEVFNVFQAEGLLAEANTTMGALIRLPDFQPTFSVAQQQKVEDLLRMFRENPYTPPVRTEAEALAGQEVLNALIEQGKLIKLNDGILFLSATYDEAIKRLLAHIHARGQVTVAEARDVLGATRKYILPLLEHMDERRLTRRVGDERILGTASLSQEFPVATEDPGTT